MRWTAGLTGLMLLAASGCATSGPSADTFCRIARPIPFQTGDRLTPVTEDRILRHNEKGAALCGW